MSAPATRYARTGEVHVAYQLTGNGPPLVLVADWFGHLDTRWEWPAYAYALERMGTFSQVDRVRQARHRALRPRADRPPPRSRGLDGRRAGRARRRRRRAGRRHGHRGRGGDGAAVRRRPPPPGRSARPRQRATPACAATTTTRPDIRPPSSSASWPVRTPRPATPPSSRARPASPRSTRGGSATSATPSARAWRRRCGR